jgi:uncharacterized protein involved in type VI secretion and phage assembly
MSRTTPAQWQISPQVVPPPGWNLTLPLVTADGQAIRQEGRQLSIETVLADVRAELSRSEEGRRYTNVRRQAMAGRAAKVRADADVQRLEAERRAVELELPDGAGPRLADIDARLSVARDVARTAASSSQSLDSIEADAIAKCQPVIDRLQAAICSRTLVALATRRRELLNDLTKRNAEILHGVAVCDAGREMLHEGQNLDGFARAVVDELAS